jgi:hypothetical protein
MLEVDKILQLKEEYILYKLDVGDGKFWLFNIENGDSFKLNRTSYTMLSLTNGKRSIAEINGCLLDMYSSTSADKDSILEDFETLIIKMRKHNIIEERR